MIRSFSIWIVQAPEVLKNRHREGARFLVYPFLWNRSVVIFSVELNY